MATLNEVVEGQKMYKVTLNQDEVELILLLTGELSNDDIIGRTSGDIWEALDNGARGSRMEYIIDGEEYTADVSVEKVDNGDSE